jgi:hypothetical protein
MDQEALMAARDQRTFPSTRRRVRRNTDEHINRRIDDQIARNVRYFADHPDEIAQRLAELDEEWDVERMIEANAASLALAGTVLGLRSSRVYLALPLAVTGFLLQHAVQGWCPPVPLLRRLGFRTQDEINAERYALKALRGDFGSMRDKASAADTASAAIRAVRG